MGRLIADMIVMIVLFFNRRTLWRLGRYLYRGASFGNENQLIRGVETVQRQFLAEACKHNEKLVIFDVGANVGDWTYPILQKALELKIGGRLEIHAFEPVPGTFKTIEDRIAKHPLSNSVRLICNALSNEEGTAEMFIVGKNAGTNSLHQDIMAKSSNRIYVSKTTLDLYCAKNNIDSIHFLKCDAEGHDMEILYGANSLFEKSRIMVCQFEYNHRWVYSRHYLKDVFSFAKTIPYNIGKITPNGLEIYDNWHPELERFMEGNYVLVHKNSIHWFKTQIGGFDSDDIYSPRLTN